MFVVLSTFRSSKKLLAEPIGQRLLAISIAFSILKVEPLSLKSLPCINDQQFAAK